MLLKNLKVKEVTEEMDNGEAVEVVEEEESKKF